MGKTRMKTKSKLKTSIRDCIKRMHMLTSGTMKNPWSRLTVMGKQIYAIREMLREFEEMAKLCEWNDVSLRSDYYGDQQNFLSIAKGVSKAGQKPRTRMKYIANYHAEERSPMNYTETIFTRC